MQKQPSIPLHGAIPTGVSPPRKADSVLLQSLLHKFRSNAVDPLVIADQVPLSERSDPLINSGVDCVLLHSIQRASNVVWTNDIPIAIDQQTYFPGNSDLQHIWSYANTICYTGTKNETFAGSLPPPMPPYASVERALTFLLLPIGLVALLYACTKRCCPKKKTKPIWISGRGPPPDSVLTSENSILRRKVIDGKEDHAEIRSEASNLRQALADAEERLKKTSQENRELRRENDELVIKNRTFDKENLTLHEDLHKKDEQVRKAEEKDEDGLSWEEQYKQLSERFIKIVERRDEEGEAKDAALKELKAIKAAATLKTETTGARDDEQASASTQAELATALKTAGLLKNQLTDTQAALAGKEEELVTAQKALETKQDEHYIQLTSTQNTLADTQEKLAVTKKALTTKQEECDNKQNIVDQAAKLTIEKQTQVNTAEKEVEELKLQLATAISTQASLPTSDSDAKRIEQLENELRKTEHKLDTKQNKVRELNRSLQKAQQDHQAQIKKLQEQLETTKAGRGDVTSVQELERELEETKKQMQKIETSNEISETALETERAKVRKLEAEMKQQREAAKKSHIRSNEYEKLKKELATSLTTLKSTQGEIEALKVEKTKAEMERDNALAGSRDMEQQLAIAKSNEASKSTLNSIQSKLDAAQSELDAKRQHLNDALQRAVNAEGQIEQLQQQLNSVQVSSSSDPAEVQALREQLIEAQRNLEAANADGASKSVADAAQIEALQTKINTNRTMMDSAETTFAAMKKERDDALTRLDTSNGAGDSSTLKKEFAQARNMVAILKQELVTQGAAAQKAMEDREQIGKSNRQNFDEEIRKERKLAANKRDLLEKALQKEKNAVKGLDKDIAAKATQLRTQEAKITELTEALQKCQDNRAATQKGDVDMLGDEGATDERVKKLQEELAAAQQSALEKGWEIRRNVQALANKDQEIQSRDQQIGHWRAGQT
jgi:chromosome segregation ATPase